MPPDRPVIGIDPQLTAEDDPHVRLSPRYAAVILKAGGLPLILPPIGGPGDMRRMLDAIDGLLFTGGDDFDTERLGLGPTHVSATPVPTAKQDWDVELARIALERGMPTLGICYGMQLMGLTAGSELFQHLPEDMPDAQEHRGNVVHPVFVDEGTKLGRLIGVGSIDVISRHHQALSDAPDDWLVSARDAGGLVEAIELADHPFALGVQWHPELASEGSEQDGLFRGLVGAAALAAPAC